MNKELNTRGYKMNKHFIMLILIALVTACAEIEPKPFEPSSGHVQPNPSTTSTQAGDAPTAEIPALVDSAPVLPEPAQPEPQERYTVVVNEVPVKELLFALARDAQVNVDIHPEIDGVVTINAVEQTLPQILKRISKQIDMRYEYDGDNLLISRDTPFLRTYTIDYVNLSREMVSTSSITTQISSTSGGDASGASGGGNTSTTDVSTESNHRFWQRLVTNISAILGEESGGAGGEIPITDTVIPNPESGVITVRATEKQHEQVQQFIDRVLVSAKRQVMIQATIVEVELNERYQAGIDWSALSTGAFSVASATAGGVPTFTTAALSSFIIQTDDSDGRPDNITATVSLLDEFGDANILSSPQVMALNNQTALLKVVENLVYFEVDSETTAGALGAAPVVNVDTTAQTVPVGIVMTVTPQIDSNGVITLVVRPTISRFVRSVNDPNPQLTVANPVPEIAVREMESVLRMTDGQIGVLGGLMTDETKDNDAGLPGAKDAGVFGNLFKTTNAEYTKTELVIFIRPIIISNPSLDGDLSDYKNFLLNTQNTLGNNKSLNSEQ